MYSPSTSTPRLSPHNLPELLLVDSEETTSRFIVSLREKFRVSRIDSIGAAVQHVTRTPSPPALVVTELQLADGSGTMVCRAVKSLNAPATVLVTTSDVERVPDAIEAGCDAVLLKPFAPNLLFARLGRLLRARSSELMYRASHHRAKSLHVHERADAMLAGTNHNWPNTHCPKCGHAGVTSFEYTSYRRAWYACLGCRSVWLSKRQE